MQKPTPLRCALLLSVVWALDASAALSQPKPKANNDDIVIKGALMRYDTTTHLTVAEGNASRTASATWGTSECAKTITAGKIRAQLYDTAADAPKTKRRATDGLTPDIDWIEATDHVVITVEKTSGVRGKAGQTKEGPDRAGSGKTPADQADAAPPLHDNTPNASAPSPTARTKQTMVADHCRSVGSRITCRGHVSIKAADNTVNGDTATFDINKDTFEIGAMGGHQTTARIYPSSFKR
jgi:lipopolysaccharide export system protein LptA